jgi:hypothetical protein
MDWEEVGAIGQLLGSLAVFVTLIYLASQVRFARAEYMRSISQHRADAIRDLYSQEREEPIRKIYVRLNAALGGTPTPFEQALIERGATPDEAFAMHTMQLMLWNYRLQMIPYLDELTPMDRVTFVGGVHARYGKPGVGRVVLRIAHPTDATPRCSRVRGIDPEYAAVSRRLTHDRRPVGLKDRRPASTRNRSCRGRNRVVDSPTRCSAAPTNSCVR